MSVQVLTLGQNPNLAFYAWRLHHTRSCAVTMVTSAFDPALPILWDSQLPGSDFVPAKLVPSMEHLDSAAKFDVVILSVSTLQSFQEACVLLGPHVAADTLIVVESTGCVNLEPFVQMSFPKFQGLPVCLIMNESSVKRVPGTNSLLHRVAGGGHRIYLGSCHAPDGEPFTRLFARFYKLLQLVQEDSNGHISLLKSTAAREFMTYQWKLALPRIVLNPLSVLFEQPLPARLHDQILAKPLIAGLVNEVFKIIKKMDCKLVKGYENEANLVLNWLAVYPDEKGLDAPVPFLRANLLFYNFYHRQDVDIDLLLLQPILLGDDHGVRTPYLENLYSVMCQYLKINTAGSSLFFERSLPGLLRLSAAAATANAAAAADVDLVTAKLGRLRVEHDKCFANIKNSRAELEQLHTSMAQKKDALAALVADLENQVRRFELQLKEHADAHAHQQRVLADLNDQVLRKLLELESLQQAVLLAKRTELNAVSSDSVQPQEKLTHNQPSNHPIRQAQQPSQIIQQQVSNPAAASEADRSVPQTPDLSDFADVAVYGATLNGEVIPSRASIEKELELLRREQALAERERELNEKVAREHSPAYQHPAQHPQSHPHQAQQPQLQALQALQAQQTQQPLHHSHQKPHQQTAQQPHQQVVPQLSQQQQTQPYQQIQSQAHPQAQPPREELYGNGAVGSSNNYASGPYRPSHSLTAASQGYFDAAYDQRPPHGLPTNGMPQSSLPQALQTQRFPTTSSVPQASSQLRQRMSSFPAMGYPAHQQLLQFLQLQQQFAPQQYQQQFPQQYQQRQFPQQGQFQQDPAMGQYNSFPKKHNRRSAFPGQELNIDYGGRGGMPMPTASKAKHRSTMSGQVLPPSPTPNQQKRSSSNGPHFNGATANGSSSNGQTISASSDHLQLPVAGSKPSSLNSNSSHESMHSSNGAAGPEYAQAEIAPKPLGGIAPDTSSKKKKRGIFRKTS